MKCFVEITSNVRLLSNFGPRLTLLTNNNSVVSASLLFYWSGTVWTLNVDS